MHGPETIDLQLLVVILPKALLRSRDKIISMHLLLLMPQGIRCLWPVLCDSRTLWGEGLEDLNTLYTNNSGSGCSSSHSSFSCRSTFWWSTQYGGSRLMRMSGSYTQSSFHPRYLIMAENNPVERNFQSHWAEFFIYVPTDEHMPTDEHRRKTAFSLKFVCKTHKLSSMLRRVLKQLGWEIWILRQLSWSQGTWTLIQAAHRWHNLNDQF